MVLEVGGYKSLEALESFKGALKVRKLWTHIRIQDTPDYGTALEVARKFVLLEKKGENLPEGDCYQRKDDEGKSSSQAR